MFFSVIAKNLNWEFQLRILKDSWQKKAINREGLPRVGGDWTFSRFKRGPSKKRRWCFWDTMITDINSKYEVFYLPKGSIFRKALLKTFFFFKWNLGLKFWPKRHNCYISAYVKNQGKLETKFSFCVLR